MTKKRGRPLGTGKNDFPYLTQVADFMVADPKLKPTTAMKRVRATRKAWDESDETLLRRWQVKWKEMGADLLVAAKERAVSKSMRSSGGYTPAHGYAGIAAYHAFKETAAMKIMRAFAEPPIMKTIRTIEDSTMTKVMRDMQRMQDMIDPPWLRQVREQERLERTIRDLIDPPYLRAARGTF